MSSVYSGVTFYEEDRDNGPFTIRISGTKEFVSNIRDGYYSRWGSPGKCVTLVEGWDNPATIIYKTMDEAIRAATQVWEIEGLHTSIEVIAIESR
jgi:hypothetical protein|tara:strand:+ start:142 stop:426 length:285 start_codon:yes stop_codon:yes gene_type:complete